MNKIISILSILLLPIYALYGQEDITISDVEVVKAFEAKLIDAKRVSTSPIIPDMELTDPRYQYNINIIPLELEYPDPVIRPLAMKTDPRKEPKMAWLKAGYGTLLHPYIDAGYNLFIEDLYSASVYGHYEGGKQTIDNDIYRSYSQLDLRAEGTYFLHPTMSIFTNVGYSREKRSIGFTDAVSRSFDHLTVGGGIRNTEPIRDNIFYSVGLDFNLLNESTEEITETVISIPASFSYKISDLGLFNITNDFEFSKAFDTYDASVVNQLNAHYKNTTGSLSYKIGGDIIHSKNSKSIFPDLLFSYALLDRKLNLELGSDQDYYRYNMQGLYLANPYYLFSKTIDDINITRSIFAGANGKLSSFSFEARGGYKLLSNIYSFVNSSADATYFENQNIPITKSTAVFMEGNLSYKWSDWLSVSGNLTQHFYNSDIEIYHLPNVEARTKIMLHDPKLKWNVYSSLQFTDKVTVLNTRTNAVENLNSQIDFSLGGDYFILDNLGLYLEANNLFSNNYERWNGYRDFGINFYGGIKLKF